ncbi:MAG: hypothetical protein KH366_11795 [Clostridiaceae bacterium]|nr:hypothetical protein [Clostridiaceae bacterium]
MSAIRYEGAFWRILFNVMAKVTPEILGMRGVRRMSGLARDPRCRWILDPRANLRPGGKRGLRPGSRVDGVRFAVSAHGSGRGISRVCLKFISAICTPHFAGDLPRIQVT